MLPDRPATTHRARARDAGEIDFPIRYPFATGLAKGATLNHRLEKIIGARVTHWALRGAAALICLAVAACHEVVVRPAEAWVTNRTSAEISVIRYRPCNQPQAGWDTLLNSGVAAGSSMRLDLPLDCVDLMAFHPFEKIVGTQQGIRRSIPFRWNIY